MNVLNHLKLEHMFPDTVPAPLVHKIVLCFRWFACKKTKLFIE